MARTVGIEEEFLLADLQGRSLRDAGDEVTSIADDRSRGQFDSELKSEQVELATAPHESMDDLARDLRARRRELDAAARERNARLLASATSPVHSPATVTAGHERYQRIHDVYGELAQMQLTCGMHVHVAIENADEGVAVIDTVRPWLSTLLALTANSPFWDGRDTGYASFRTVLWSQWPSAGPTEPFRTVERYNEVRADLLASGGAMDDGMIYYLARLSQSYPTVEFRVADVCVDTDDALVVAALVRALVEGRATGSVRDLRTETLRAASWRAARYGMTADLIDLSQDASPRPAWDVVDALVACVGPALESAGDLGLVQEGLARIRDRGTGADLQRRAFARRGRLSDVLDAVAESSVPASA